MAKRKLKINPDFDFLLIGIVTALQDYRLAWFINNTLHKTLAKKEDIQFTDPLNKKQMNFARFDFDEAITRSVFHLLQNKHANECLLPEYKELDFVLLIKGDYYKTRKNDILKKLRGLENVQAALILDVELIKSKNNLLIEL